jgi:hypothetical protein
MGTVDRVRKAFVRSLRKSAVRANTELRIPHVESAEAVASLEAI